MANVQTNLSRIDNERKVRADGYLLPYQVRQAFNESRLRWWEKSVRIGATYEKAFEAVRDRLIPGKGDYLHTSVTQQVAQGFLEDCEFWLGAYQAAGAVTSRSEEEYLERLVDDNEQDVLDPAGAPIYVHRRAFEWKFDTGQKLRVFSSNPQALRGFGGAVGVDELAFHVRMSAMLQAAGSRAMWGFPISLWTSHNGEDSEWNQFLLREKQLGDASIWSGQTTTLLDAIEDGLVEKINETRGTTMTRDQFIEQTKALLGSIEAYEEECLCIARMRGLPAVPWIDILAAQRDYHVDCRTVVGDAVQGQQVDPSVEALMAENVWKALDTAKRHSLGYDVARNGHLSSVFVNENDGKNHRCVLNIRLRKCKLPSQRKFIEQGMRALYGMTGAGDSTGLGLQVCEELSDLFPGRFEMVNFSTFKPHIVGRLRGAYQDGRVIIPREPSDIAHDVRGIQCQTNGIRTTYSEAKNPANEHSHCDIAYSQALAIANAEDGAAGPVFGETVAVGRSGAANSDRTEYDRRGLFRDRRHEDDFAPLSGAAAGGVW
jgi:phage FluMu gp28-like protein